MNALSPYRSLLSSPLLLIFMGLVCLYAGYHFAYGQRGVVAYIHLHTQLQQERAALESDQQAHETIHTQVVRLRPGSVDPDYLEEQVMRVLGRRLSGPSDLVVQSQL